MGPARWAWCATVTCSCTAHVARVEAAEASTQVCTGAGQLQHGLVLARRLLARIAVLGRHVSRATPAQCWRRDHEPPSAHLPRDAGRMGTRRRCSECRHTFTPSPRARSTQRVCCQACRGSRNRKLARVRRRKDLDAYRNDERERQRDRRLTKRRSQSTPAVALCPRCHAHASASKYADLPEDLLRFVDRAFAKSRASLLRDLRRRWPRPEATAATGGV